MGVVALNPAHHSAFCLFFPQLTDPVEDLPCPFSFSGARRVKEKVWEATSDASLVRFTSRGPLHSQHRMPERVEAWNVLGARVSVQYREDRRALDPKRLRDRGESGPTTRRYTRECGATLLLDFSLPQFTNCSQRGITCVIFQSVCPGIIYMI